MEWEENVELETLLIESGQMEDEKEDTTESDETVSESKEVDDVMEGELEDDLVLEDVVIYDPIAFSEDHVRVFKRDEDFLISESDFDAVFNHYAGEKDGYEVLNTIAESHDISSDNIVIFLAEGSLSEATGVKKAKGKLGTKVKDALQQQIQSLRDQINKLPPASTSAKQKKKQLRKLKARVALQS